METLNINDARARIMAHVKAKSIPVECKDTANVFGAEKAVYISANANHYLYVIRGDFVDIHTLASDPNESWVTYRQVGNEWLWWSRGKALSHMLMDAANIAPWNQQLPGKPPIIRKVVDLNDKFVGYEGDIPIVVVCYDRTTDGFPKPYVKAEAPPPPIPESIRKEREEKAKRDAMSTVDSVIVEEPKKRGRKKGIES